MEIFSGIPGKNITHCLHVCKMWCHKKCSGLRDLNGVHSFRCRKCVNGKSADGDDSLEINGMTVKEVQDFCYLGDVLDREAGTESAVRARIAIAWKKWRELASLLTNKGIPLS